MCGIKRKENIINFYCKSCKSDFDCNVGKVDFPIEKDMPEYERAVICSSCKAEYVSNKDKFSDKFELTELGQSQMTALFFEDVDFGED